MEHLIQHCQSVEEENNFAKDPKPGPTNSPALVHCFLSFICYTILITALS